MKRLLAILLTMVITVTLFVGCSNNGNSTDETTTAIVESAKAAESATDTKVKSDVTLSYMASQDWIYDSEYTLAKNFENETGIKLDFQVVPADQYSNLLLTKLNTGECTDLFGNQSGKFDLVSQLNIEKNAVDLSNESWVDRFDKFSAAELSANGKLYGVTIYDNTTDFYVVYNRTLFNKLGLKEPTTYKEFKSVCEAIKAAGTIPVYECISEGWHHVMWFCEIGERYNELNPGLIDKLNSNKATFAETSCFADNINQIVEMANLGYWGDNYMSNTYADLPKSLNEGKYAMTLGKPGTINEIVAYDAKKCTADDFGLFVIPLNDNQILNVHPCAASKFIYSGSSHIKEAKQYFDYLCSPENLQFIIDNEPRYENLPFTGLKAEYSDYTKEFMARHQKQGVVLQDQVKYLNPQWFDIGIDISAVLTGTMTTEKAVKNIDKRRTDQAEASKDTAWTK
jgi:raffinose/stachyose/melibiose transport system substrate-binding protein